MKRWIWNILVSIDQFVNALLGGDPDETLSSRAAKANTWTARLLCWFIGIFDKDHCAKNIEYDEGKRL